MALDTFCELTGVPKQAPRFSPYDDNQGTLVSIAGSDFVVVASDTRLCSGYSIFSRMQPKLFKLSDKTVLACTGCWCDALTFSRILEARMKMYQHEHNKVMSTTAAAQLVSCMLYYKRFFPYYVSTIIAGIDENGEGCVYSYDCVGNKNKGICQAAGSSCSMIQPLLDNQISGKNMSGPEDLTPMSQERAVAIIKDVYTASAERDIHTGDGILMYVITKEGIKEISVPLRKD